ncbi:diacylglycerol/lipid kinase family protein, partial [Ornithinicoccus halotolerans]|uniref:diacylglycerol/lipid kinase family protein n=1 Tax=Ornithinicoccus halotolerans TaxID=1748220 RepID=UPI0038994D5B
ALHGTPRPADLLRDEGGGVVVNVAHAGVSAQATAHAQDVKRFLGTLGYAFGAVRAGFTAPGRLLRVRVDGEEVEDGSRRVLMVTVALGTSIGGGAPVAPQARPDDAVADVIVATADSPLARAGYGIDLRRGTHLDRDDVRVLQGKHVQVVATAPEEAFLVNTDGEVEDRRMERSWRLVPHCWRIRSTG